VYAPEQPDLNWENPDCRRAIFESAVQFWLDKGIDGFRVDTVNRYSKDTSFLDVPVTDPTDETQLAFQNFTNGPRIHEYISLLRDTLTGYDVFTVGELPNTPEPRDVMRFISAREKQIDMVFNFDTVYLGQTPGDRFSIQEFTRADFKRELTKWQKVIQGTDAWTTVFLENHDQGRSVSRFTSDDPVYRCMGTKMLAMVLCTMTGTLYLYQGQEIGMINAPLSYPVEEYKCVRSVNYYDKIRQQTKNDPVAMEKAHEALQKVARDHARVPMQWNSDANAGFCSANAKPWMRVLDSYLEINVADQIGKENSSLEFWRSMIGLRKRHKELFVYGTFNEIEQHEDILIFTKESADGRMSLTVANLANESRPFTLQSRSGVSGSLNLAVCSLDAQSVQPAQLAAFECRIYISSEGCVP
jgi:glycosidase